MKCPSCGIGFIPEMIEAIVNLPVAKSKPGNAALAGVVLTMMLAALCAALVSVWLGLGLAVVGLLAVIAVQLGRQSPK